MNCVWPRLGGAISLLLLSIISVSAEAGEWRVMSFNIRYGNADDGPNAWPNRQEIVVDTIRQHDPDLLGLQECLEFQADYIVQQLPQYRWFGVGRDPDGTGERMAVMYRATALSPIASGNFWLSETPDVPGTRAWESACNRMVTWGKFYRHSDKSSIYFFNTHLDHESEEARRQGAAVLRDRIREIAGDAPIIVTGDFNARAEQSIPWETLAGAGFADAWLTAEERNGPPATWSGFNAPQPDSNRRIDWILTAGPLAVRWCETVTFNVENRYPSDHFPVFARIAAAQSE